MRFSKIALIFALVAAPFVSIQANTCDGNLERVYLMPEDIFIDQTEIIVILNGEVTPVTQLHVDDQGVFIEVVGRVPVGAWECPRCGVLNSVFNRKCVKCKWPD